MHGAGGSVGQRERSARRGATPAAAELVSEATAAFAAVISSVGLSIALAALIFTGPLQDGLSRATTNFVLAGAVVTLLVGVRGRFRPTIAVLQDGPAVVLVALAAGIAGSSTPNPTGDVFALIALTTLLTGAGMLVIGYLGVGGAARFFPTTVVGGFIAGTGWLLAKGGFDVMLDVTLGVDDLSMLVQPESIKFWLPGAILGVSIQALGAIRRVPPVAMSLAVIGALVLFFVVVLVTSSIDSAEEANWFIGPFPDGANPALLTPSDLADADWTEILGRPGGILAAIAVSLVAILLNLMSLEALTGDRLETRRELESAGFANLLIAPFGSVAGFHAIGDTALARQMGARSVGVPVAVAAVSAIAVVFGSEWIGLTPRIIAGGLLVAVGLALLGNWITSMRATTSRIERVLSILILLSIGAVGILEGITFGLVAACLIFVVRYSRIDPVKLETTASDIPSRVVRPAADQEVLDRTADRVSVFQLTGYQFFGSFASVVERVRARAEGIDPPLSSVILDFRLVTGIDSSALTLLDQVASDLAELDVQLLLSDLDPGSAASLSSGTPALVAGLDFAIEQAENRLLTTAATTNQIHPEPFASLSPGLTNELTRRSIEAGQPLIEQGSDGAGMFLILSGDLWVTRRDSDGSLHRLRGIGSGTIVGEHALLLGTPRSAGVTAETAVEVLEVTAEDYERLRREHPTLALELQDLLLHELARRSVSLSEHLSRALR